MDSCNDVLRTWTDVYIVDKYSVMIVPSTCSVRLIDRSQAVLYSNEAQIPAIRP